MDRSELRRSFSYGEARIAFTIRFVSATSDKVRISLLPDGRVRADAPEGTDPDEVVRAVRRRARWIWQQQEAWRTRRAHVLPREYVSGESHFYLGRRHVLKVLVSRTEPAGVKMLRGRLEVTSPDAGRKRVRALLDGWYRQRAKEVFAKRLALCAERANWLKTLPPVRLLNMKTQWGSCSPEGALIIHPLLVKAPSACIDYVLSHELCHIREHNHGDRFYRLLAGMLPEWEACKRELDDMAELILNR